MEMPKNRTQVPLTPEMKRKLIIRRADEAVGKANFVLRDMKRKLEAIKQESITEPANRGTASPALSRRQRNTIESGAYR